MSSRDERVEKAMAELKRVDDARLASLVDGRAANAMFEEVVGMTEPIPERRGHAVRTWTHRPRLLWRVAIVAAVVAVVAIVLAVADPFESNGLTVVQRAVAALAPADGQILHVKMLGEQTNPDGSVVTWSDESWQATASPFDRRQIQTGPDGTVAESGTIDGGPQLYDPANETIYAPSAEALATSAPPASDLSGLPPLDKIVEVYIQVAPDSQTISLKLVVRRNDGTTFIKKVTDSRKAKALLAAWKISKDEDQARAGTSGASPEVQADPFRAKILSLLKSGKVREDGRVSIDGREAIRLVGTGDLGGEVYIVDATTHAPIELRTTGDGGGVVLRFVVYEAFADSSSAHALLDLRAQHPDARVDADPADYRKAEARLFPNG